MSSLSSPTHACCVTKGPALSDEESEKWEGYSLVIQWIQIESKSFSRTVGIDIRLFRHSPVLHDDGDVDAVDFDADIDHDISDLLATIKYLGPPSRR
ncbi:hypothetical protein CY34DRAFT_18015 [Suillus luteus UH-Slu-Lm8-n1]|uniref:Uncharacterized protein n=1 Tax=Suillus luteus UH-Slu-Lm8-n1 TaxID=930992 RepID=A0A0D0AIH1_9AGAM|nr:hypothetical protein CY34DRAFT_18015 [Suillus luteus UH-Slu-Lm8-n1]